MTMIFTPAAGEIEVLPSGQYAVKEIAGQSGPVLQVFQNIKGYWHATPGQWYAKTLQQHQGFTLAIDFGQGWALSEKDTHALITLAHRY